MHTKQKFFHNHSSSIVFLSEDWSRKICCFRIRKNTRKLTMRKMGMKFSFFIFLFCFFVCFVFVSMCVRVYVGIVNVWMYAEILFCILLFLVFLLMTTLLFRYRWSHNWRIIWKNAQNLGTCSICKVSILYQFWSKIIKFSRASNLKEINYSIWIFINGILKSRIIKSYEN